MFGTAGSLGCGVEFGVGWRGVMQDEEGVYICVCGARCICSAGTMFRGG